MPRRATISPEDQWPGLGRWIVTWLVKVVVVGLASVTYLNMGAQLIDRFGARGWMHLAMVCVTYLGSLAILSAVEASWQVTARRRQLAFVSELLFLALCGLMMAYGLHMSVCS